MQIPKLLTFPGREHRCLIIQHRFLMWLACGHLRRTAVAKTLIFLQTTVRHLSTVINVLPNYRTLSAKIARHLQTLTLVFSKSWHIRACLRLSWQSGRQTDKAFRISHYKLPKLENLKYCNINLTLFSAPLGQSKPKMYFELSYFC